MPSPKFKDLLIMVEERFRALHEETVYSYEDPIETLAALLQVEFPEIPSEILELQNKVFHQVKKT